MEATRSTSARAFLHRHDQLILGAGEPDDPPTPSTVVGWSNAPQANKASYSDLAIKQPFMIGDGKNSGGTAQRYLVPPGATRLLNDLGQRDFVE